MVFAFSLNLLRRGLVMTAELSRGVRGTQEPEPVSVT